MKYFLKGSPESGDNPEAFESQSLPDENGSAKNRKG